MVFTSAALLSSFIPSGECFSVAFSDSEVFLDVSFEDFLLTFDGLDEAAEVDLDFEDFLFRL